MIENVETTVIALVIGLAIGGIGSGVITKRYVTNDWAARMAKQDLDDAKQLQDVTDEITKIAQQRNNLATELEVQHEISQHNLEQVYRRNRELSSQLGGLRDPGKKVNGGAGDAATDASSKPVDRTASGNLSAEATGFLLDYARQADVAADYAGTCYRWINQIRGAQHVD